MIEQEYTLEDLKKAMLNEACPKMEAYYSDLYDDFQMLDKMEVGQTAQWFYRKKGTTLAVEDPKKFQNDCEFWKDQIFEAYTILMTGENAYSVTESPLNK